MYYNSPTGNKMDGEDYNYCIIHKSPILYTVQGRTHLFKELDLYVIVLTSMGPEAYNVGRSCPSGCLIADWSVFEGKKSDKERFFMIERLTGFNLTNGSTLVDIWGNDVDKVYQYLHK